MNDQDKEFEWIVFKIRMKKSWNQIWKKRYLGVWWTTNIFILRSKEILSKKKKSNL